MQERYLGDVHDYVKWSLVIHLHNELNCKIGVNWYKTEPGMVDQPGNEHGNNRGYRNDPVWQNWNRELFRSLEPFQDSVYRKIDNFTREAVLPEGTVFAPNEYCTIEDRESWHKRAVSALDNAEIVFLDPDNGFQVRSWTRRTRPKYAMFTEAHDYFNHGKIVFGIQFVSKRDPIQRGREIRDLLMQDTDAQSLPVLRARGAPNILFIFLCPREKSGGLKEALDSFVAKSPKFNAKQRRIEYFN